MTSNTTHERWTAAAPPERGFTIGPYRVAAGAPLFVIAEIGLNHGGDVGKALALVDAAATAGASAVKLQSLRGASLVAEDCPAPAHVDAASLREFFSAFELDREAHRRVAARARERGLAFMSTPFDEDAVAMLDEIGADALKIASGDVTHLRLIARAARTCRPLVISTGMATLDEVAGALRCAREAGAGHVALLHCVSAYPTPPASANLAAITTLARAFDVPVGLSDHGTDPLAPALAVALGACLYERHVVASRSDEAIDRAVSSTPGELADSAVLAARAHVLLGSPEKTCVPAEAPNRPASRRGVYAARPLRAGHVLTDADLTMLRPARGVPAERWLELIGRRVTTDVAAGEPFPVDILRPTPKDASP